MEPNTNIQAHEAELLQAIVATPVYPQTYTVTTADISRAIERQYGPSVKPTNIISFPPDYILEFATPTQRNAIDLSRPLFGPGFTFDLFPWERQYRSQMIPWTTPITITIMGIPPHAYNPECLLPILSPYCNIQTFYFDKDTGICHLDAYAASTETIPRKSTFGLSYSIERGQGISNETFPITLQTSPYAEYQSLQQIQPSHPHMSYTNATMLEISDNTGTYHHTLPIKTHLYLRCLVRLKKTNLLFA